MVDTTAMPSFRWIEESRLTQNEDNDVNKEYTKLEIVVEGKKDTIQVHDSVLLCSDDIEVNEKNSNSTLDTFVARVEKMWEEPESSKPGTAHSTQKAKEEMEEEYPHERKMRMKIRARWYFKKKDMQDIRGNFAGINRRNFLNNMTPYDLILGEHSDDNEVTTILAKCQVIKRRPDSALSLFDHSSVKASGNTIKNIDFKLKHPFYICSYTVYIPKKEEEGFGTVLIHPYDGPNDDLPNTSPPHETKIVTVSENQSSKIELEASKKNKTTSRKRNADAMMLNENIPKSSKPENFSKENDEMLIKKIKSNDRPDSNVIETGEENIPTRNRGIDDNRNTDIGEVPVKAEKRVSIVRAENPIAKGDQNIEESTSSQPYLNDEDEIKEERNEDDEKNKMEKDSSMKASSSSGHDADEDDEDSASSQKSLILESNTSNYEENGNPKIAKEGTIHIGVNHQAIIPKLSREACSVFSRAKTEKRLNSKSTKDINAYNKPTHVWSPGSISEDDFDQYISDAAAVLKNYMNGQGIETVGAPASTILMGALGDGLKKDIELESLSSDKAESSSGTDQTLTSSWNQTDRKPRVMTRECKVDLIIETLHNSSYSTHVALKKIRQNPLTYLTIWNSNEKESFNTGFRRYRGSLRSISKGVSSKTYKDVIDYHYRFKIPCQFRKYQEKKREQARRMMGISNENRATNSISSNRKSRYWAKVGAPEQRKVAAKEFLVQVRDTIGIENYLLLASQLKLYQSKNQSVAVLKENVAPLLQSNTALLQQFLEFLPKKYRT